MSSLPSGVRLVRLLNEHLNDIMNRERANQNSFTCIARVLTGWHLSARPISCAMCSRTARLRQCVCSATLFLW